MKAKTKKDINRIFREHRRVTDEAWSRAFVRPCSSQEGSVTVVVERDGKIAWVTPEGLGY